jgi:outer membrane protein assembly factor BamE (lipoprotein component of BamABCDE complex)
MNHNPRAVVVITLRIGRSGRFGCSWQVAEIEFAAIGPTLFRSRRKQMKVKAMLAALVVCLAAAAVCFAADDAFTGTWKLNEAKSKLSAGMNKNTTVVYAVSGDSIKVTLDGVAADGKATHDEWIGKFDGKDYPVTGNPLTDTRAYKKVNERTLEATGKKGDKVVLTAKITVSADGKSRTVVATQTGADGKKSTSTAVYDKQ